MRFFLKKKLKSTAILEVFLIFIFSLTPLLWFKDSTLILGHDSGFRLKYTQYLVDLFYSWNPVVGFGTDLSLYKGFLITQLPETMFSFIFGGLHTGQMVTFVSWFFLMGLSMFIFTNTLFPKPQYWMLRISASFLYMFNFFVLQGWFIAERAKFSLLIALPLCFLLIYMTLLRKWDWKKASLLFGLLFFFFNGGGSPPLYGAVLLAIGITSIILTCFNIKQRGIKEAFFSIKVLFFMGLSAFLCSAYWVIPQIYLAISSYESTLISKGGIEGIILWEAVVSKYASISNLLRLQGIPDWYENPFHPYSSEYLTNTLLIVMSFVPILVITLGMFFYSGFKKEYKNNVLIVLLLTLLITGLLFAAGSHPPFGAFYLKMIEYIPGFAIFRSAFYKFGPLIWFAISFLFGYFLCGVIARYKNNLFIKYPVYLGVLLYFVLFSLPFFTSDFFQWHQSFTTRVRVPDYVFHAADYINTQTDPSTRVLLIPGATNDVDQYTWGFWSFDSLPLLSLNRSVISNDTTARDINIDSLYEVLYQRNIQKTEQALHALGIQGVLVREDVLEKEGLENNYESFAASISGEVKAFDKWRYYHVRDSEPSVFSIPKSINLVDSSFSGSSFLSSASAVISNSQREGNTYDKEYAVPTCVICTPFDYWNIEKGVEIPNPQILPGSLLYTFVSDKEEKEFAAARTNPTQIDVLLSQSMRRLAELDNLSCRQQNQKSAEIISQTAKSYISLLSEIENLLLGLSNLEKEQYYPRLIAYLSVHRKYTEVVGHKRCASVSDINRVLEKQQEVLGSLRSAYELSDELGSYILSIKTPGVYKIVSDGNADISSLQIDGKKIGAFEEIELSSGDHRLSVRMPQSENLLESPEEKAVELTYNQKKKFELDINPQKEYLVEIAVKNIEGVNPGVTVSELSENAVIIQTQTRELNQVHDRFVYQYTPHPFARRLVIEFWFDGYTYESSNFVLSKLDVTELQKSPLFFERDIENSTGPTALITESKTHDPTLYSVDVKNEAAPFLLKFNQAFSNGWKAYILPEAATGSTIIKAILFQQPLSPSQHVAVDTYANGWIIDKTGEFTVLVFYKPQLYFYLGLAISFISVCFAILYLMFAKLKNG